MDVRFSNEGVYDSILTVSGSTNSCGILGAVLGRIELVDGEATAKSYLHQSYVQQPVSWPRLWSQGRQMSIGRRKIRGTCPRALGLSISVMTQDTNL